MERHDANHSAGEMPMLSEEYFDPVCRRPTGQSASITDAMTLSE